MWRKKWLTLLTQLIALKSLHWYKTYKIHRHKPAWPLVTHLVWGVRPGAKVGTAAHSSPGGSGSSQSFIRLSVYVSHHKVLILIVFFSTVCHVAKCWCWLLTLTWGHVVTMSHVVTQVTLHTDCVVTQVTLDKWKMTTSHRRLINFHNLQNICSEGMRLWLQEDYNAK